MTSRWEFTQAPSGLFVPSVMRVENITLRFPPKPLDRVVRREAQSIGVMPGFADLWNDKLPPIPEFLATAPIEWWLCGLSSLSHLLANQTASSDEVEEFLRKHLLLESERTRLDVLAREPNGPGHFRVLDDFPVLLTIELAAAFSKATDQFGEFKRCSDRKVLAAIYQVWGDLNGSLDATTNPSGTIAAVYERSALGSLAEHLSHACGCWVWDHPFVTSEVGAIRRKFDATMSTQYGIGMRDFIAACAFVMFCLLICSLEDALKNRPIFDLPRTDLSDAGNKALRQMFEAVSSGIDEFSTNCKRLGSYSDIIRSPSLVPIKKTPVLRVGSSSNQRYWVLSPRHLLEAAFERPVRLAETLVPDDSLNIRSQFGLVVEHYVHAVLKNSFADRYTRLEPTNKRKRADGIIWYPDGCVIIECKATRVAERFRYALREDDAYSIELERGQLGKAIAQIANTIDDILNGDIVSPISNKARIFASAVVFFQEIPPSVFAASVLQRHLPPTQVRDGSTRLRTQILSLEGVAELDRWSQVNLLEVLERKMSSELHAFESLRNFLLFEGYKPSTSALEKRLGDQIMYLIKSWLTT